jgi:cytochrome c oxidase cbb3-type subunit 3
VADLPSEFWGGWIATITVASFVALLWLVIDVYRSGPDGNEQQVWDETLREGAKPAPIWWFWFILALMTISVIYVMLYPGLGTWRGALGWSMGGRIEERFVDYEGQFGTRRRVILKMPLAELAHSNSAMRSAWRVFNNNCSSCHGREATGQAQQFPDLTDAAWQWGSDESQIVETIHSGRQAEMPGWLAAAGEAGVSHLADYVLTLSRWRGAHRRGRRRRHVVPAVLRGLPWSGRRR